MQQLVDAGGPQEMPVAEKKYPGYVRAGKTPGTWFGGGPTGTTGVTGATGGTFLAGPTGP